MNNERERKNEKVNEENKGAKGSLSLIVFWLVGFLGCIRATLYLPSLGWTTLALFVVLILFGFLAIAIVYWKLAPSDIFFTFVEEGHAKAVVRGGAFHKFLIVWKDCEVDKKTWKITKPPTAPETTPTPPVGFWSSVKNFLGGLKWVGVYPFEKVDTFHFRWTNLLDSGEIRRYDEYIKQIRLKTDMYVFEMPLDTKKGAEDINGVPMGFNLVMPIRIVNPYQAFYVYGRWLGMLNGTIKPIAKRFVARYRFKEDLTNMRAGVGIDDAQVKSGIVLEDGKTPEAKPGEDLRVKLWNEIIEALPDAEKEEGEEELYIYGVALRKEGLDIIDIDPDPTYRELTTKKYEAEREAEVLKIKAKAEAKAEEKRGEGIAKGVKKRITDAVLDSLADTYGMNKEDVQEAVRENPEIKAELDKLREEARAREGMDQGAYGELNIPGGAEQLFALFSNLASKFVNPSGKPSGAPPSIYQKTSHQEPEVEKKKKGGTGGKIKTREEAQSFFQQIMKEEGIKEEDLEAEEEEETS